MPYFLILPAAIGLLMFSYYPLVYSVILSFFEWFPSLQRQSVFVGLRNWIELSKDPLVAISLANTFVFTVVSVALEFVIGLAIAIVLKRDIWGRGIIRTAIIIPMMATPIATFLLWRYLMFDFHFGLINYFLSFFAVKPVTWLSSESTAMLSIIMLDIWQWTPFMVLTLFAGLMSIPRENYEAAKVDGASRWETFRHIDLPSLRAVILIVLLIRVMDSFTVFDKVYVLTAGGPGTATYSIAYYTYQMAFHAFNLGYGATLSTLMFICIVSLSLVQMLSIRRKA
jgi:multiple sugar transport system permease protein